MRRVDGSACPAGGTSPAPADLTAPPPRDAAVPSDKLREFILPYEAVRRSDAPDDRLLDFLQASYEAAANRGGWDRAALERADRQRPQPSLSAAAATPARLRERVGRAVVGRPLVGGRAYRATVVVVDEARAFEEGGGHTQANFACFSEADRNVRRRHDADFELARLGAAVEDISRVDRSEERRVGKECRSRWSPY